MFVMILLFLNLLIAIIVDSYNEVKKNAKVLFWKQRMLHIHDLSQFKILCACIVKRICSKSHFVRSQPSIAEENCCEGEDISNSYFRVWAAAIASFADKREANDKGYFASNFWENFMRRCVCIVIIPAWLLLGLATAGYLWPPQVREYLFVARVDNEDDMLPKDEGGENITADLLHEELLIANQATNKKIVTIEADIKDIKEMLINLHVMMGKKDFLEPAAAPPFS